MELKDFIKETLMQIAIGMQEADEEVSKNGGAVNPSNVVANEAGEGPYGYLVEAHEKDKYRRHIECVDFDVVLTAVEGKETKGGLGICVGAIGVGSSGKSDKSSGTESRIQFKIPMLYPLSKK